MSRAGQHGKSSRRSSHRQTLPYPQTSQDDTAVYRVKRRYRKHRGRNVAIVALCIVLAFAAIAGTAAAMYMKSLNDLMSLGTDAEELDMVLTDVQGEEPFYVLILGSDSRAESSIVDATGSAGQSDIMLLARVDVANNKVTLVTIPRDTPYTEDDGTIVKINHEYHYGPAASVKAVEQLTGVEISHYVNMSFANFEKLVDYLGGIEADVPIEITNTDVLDGGTVTLEPGQQTLDGQQALVFARSRFDYVTEQDVHRQSAVRQIVMSIMDKVRAKPVNELPATVRELASCVSTDYQTSDLVSLAMKLSDGDLITYSGTGPCEGDIVEGLEGQPWMCYEDTEGWSNLMEVVDSGGDPAIVSYAGDTVGIPGSDETFVLGEGQGEG